MRSGTDAERDELTARIERLEREFEEMRFGSGG